MRVIDESHMRVIDESNPRVIDEPHPQGDELDALLPAKMKQTIAERNLNFYTIDATRVAKEVGLGQRINTVMQSAFYHLSGTIP